jgi:hypothetical protein
MLRAHKLAHKAAVDLEERRRTLTDEKNTYVYDFRTIRRPTANHAAQRYCGHPLRHFILPALFWSEFLSHGLGRPAFQFAWTIGRLCPAIDAEAPGIIGGPKQLP